MSESHPEHADKLGLPFEAQIKEIQELLAVAQDLKTDPNVPKIIQAVVDILAQIEALRVALKTATPGVAVDAVLVALPKFQADAEALSTDIKALYADLKQKHPNVVKLPAPSSKPE